MCLVSYCFSSYSVHFNDVAILALTLGAGLPQALFWHWWQLPLLYYKPETLFLAVLMYSWRKQGNVSNIIFLFYADTPFEEKRDYDTAKGTSVPSKWTLCLLSCREQNYWPHRGMSFSEHFFFRLPIEPTALVLVTCLNLLLLQVKVWAATIWRLYQPT